jgi:hypothetical protein
MRTSAGVRISVLLAAGAVSAPLLMSFAAITTAAGTRPAEFTGSVAGGYFGQSVAISGSTAVVGAPGSGPDAPRRWGGRAYVYVQSVRGWRSTAVLKGADTLPRDRFGQAAAIAGATIVIGAPGNRRSAGRAYVFVRTAKGWRQAAEIKGSDTVAGDSFGASVAVSGTTIVVGAPGHGAYRGRAYVFAKTAKGWRQTAALGAPRAVRQGGFGTAVAISGSTAVIGSPGYPYRVLTWAYVFTKTAKGWRQTASVGGFASGFGQSVAISGTTAIFGANTSGGTAYVYVKTATGWRQTAVLGGSGYLGDQFGYSVGISGTRAVVGMIGHAGRAGSAYVFARSATGWTRISEFTGPDTVPGDQFGWSVGASGSTVIAGAPFHARNAGRAYVTKT